MIEVVTAGVDWLSATLVRGAVMDQLWVERCLRLLDAVVADGHKLEYRSWNGYSGEGAGGGFVGEREEGHYAQVSGVYAYTTFVKTYRYDMHVSRLDIQVTVKYKNMPKRVAKEAYRDAMAENASISSSRRRKIYIIVGSDGGDTCYVGSPSSDERGRIYNKEVQSEDIHFMRTWRWEVVLKNDKATDCASRISQVTTNRISWLSDFCGHWWEKRGVSVPWLLAEAPVPVRPVRTIPTDVERKRNWLAHQVRPTVEYLLTLYDKEDILLLLGLS